MVGAPSPHVHRCVTSAGQAVGVTDVHPTLVNFRDVGGLPTADGRTVRFGRLFRSDGLHVLSDDEQLELTRRCGLETVIDLRSTMEHERFGALVPVPGGPRLVWLPILDGSALQGTVPEQRFDLASMYERIATGSGSRIGEVLAILSRPGTLPGVVYCTGGKDRTGVVVAVVLGLVGVPDDEIVADYARSSGRMRSIFQRFGDAFEPGELATVPDDFFEAPTEIMHTFLGQLRQQFGSLEAYTATLGLRTGDVEGLRAQLLEP